MSADREPGRAEVLLSLRRLQAAPPADLERLAACDGLDWALLDSYLRIGHSVRDALLAVVGDALLHAREPGVGPEVGASARRHLDHFGLTTDEVLEALGLPAA